MLAGLLLVFPSLLEALMEAIIGRDISYTATFGMADRRGGPAKTTHAAGAARSAGAADNDESKRRSKGEWT